MKKLSLSLCLTALSIMAQTTTTTLPSTTGPLPTAVSFVGEFNQLGTPRFSLGISAIYAPTAQSGIGMYNTTTADVIPVKATDPATGKSFYAISASIRQGINEKIFCAGTVPVSATKNLPRVCFLLGADIGPGFQNSPSGISVSATGSFVATLVVRVNKYLSFVAPERMLYLPGVGFNPILQAGVSLSLGAVK